MLGQSVIKFPVADAPTPEDGAGARRGVHHEVEGRPARHAGGGAARALHARRRDAAGRARAGEQARRAAADPPGGDAGRDQDRQRRAQARRRRATSRPRRLERPVAGRARRLARRRRHDDAGRARRRPGAQSREQHEARERRRRTCPTWIARGIRAGLGTDGAASNNDLDMFEAMRTAALLHKVDDRRSRRRCRRGRRSNWRRAAAPKRSAWAIASAASRPGKQADVITVAMDGARQTPMFDPISHLVYVARGDDVRTTIVAGRVLMRDGRVPYAANDATSCAMRARWPSACGEAVGPAGGPGRAGRGSSRDDGDSDRPSGDLEQRIAELARGDPARLRPGSRRSISSPCSRARSCSWPT